MYVCMFMYTLINMYVCLYVHIYLCVCSYIQIPSFLHTHIYKILVKEVKKVLL